jgi:hypothetical protein
MSLQSWLQNSWLVQQATSPNEIKNLLAIWDRDLANLQPERRASFGRWYHAFGIFPCLSGARLVVDGVVFQN